MPCTRVAAHGSYVKASIAWLLSQPCLAAALPRPLSAWRGAAGSPGDLPRGRALPGAARACPGLGDTGWEWSSFADPAMWLWAQRGAARGCLHDCACRDAQRIPDTASAKAQHL